MNYFTEKQQMTWAWKLILPIPIVIISFALYEGNLDAKWIPLTGSLILILGIMFLVMMLTLETKVDEKGIHYRMTLFVHKWKTIPHTDVTKVEVVKYSPLFDYGGWGYRIGFKGKCLNVAGNKGMRIEFGGKTLMIGTQKESELKQALIDINKKLKHG